VYVLIRNGNAEHLKDFKADVVQKEIPLIKLYRINLQKPFDDWRDIVVEWWNEFVDMGHTPKFPAMYLYGSTNSGKSYFIRNFIMKDITYQNFFSPFQSKSDFAWTAWDERNHVVGLIEEFKLSALGDSNRERLKELVAGDGFFIPLKHRNERMFIKGKIPFIYTSNHTLEEENGIVDPAIATRFLQVNANGQEYERITNKSHDIYDKMFKEEVIIIFNDKEIKNRVNL
jgi:hypothetical protein